MKLLLIKLIAAAALPVTNGDPHRSSSEEPTTNEDVPKPTKPRPRPTFSYPPPLLPPFGIANRVPADGFEIDISYSEEFKTSLSN
jgi:hypothetical protein